VNDDDDVFTFTETVKSSKRINIEANLDIDEKEDDGLGTGDDDNNNDDDDDDNERQSTSSEEEGIQQKYLRAVHDRLKLFATVVLLNRKIDIHLLDKQPYTIIHQYSCLPTFVAR
jgi:hypothetical protein